MADEGLLIPLQFTLEEARATLVQLEAQARAAGRATGQGFGTEAAKGVSGFMKTLQDFRSEQTQQGRQARFFASELMSLVPASGAARGGVEQLLGIFIEGAAGGIGFGLALEGVKFAISAVTAEYARNEQQLQALSVAQAQANMLWAQGREDVRSIYLVLTDGQRAQQAEAGKLIPRLQAIEEEYSKLKEAGPGWIANFELALSHSSASLKDYEDRLGAIAGQYAKAAEGVRHFAAMAAVLDEEQARRASGARADAQIAKDDEARRARLKANAEARKALAAEEYAAAWQMQVEEAARLTAAEKAEYNRQVQMGADLWQLEVDRAARLTELERQTTAQRVAIQQEYENFMRASMMELATSALGAFRPILTASAAYDRAMRASGKAASEGADLSASAFAAMTQNFLANLALQAASKAIFEMAEGYASAALPGGQAAAALHFAAASNYGIVAGLAAAGAVAIGATRGMTAAERASVESGSPSSAPAAGGAREFSGSGSTGSGGQVTVRETVFIVAGSEFESPAETARRAARTLELVKKLDLERRAS